LLRLRTLKLKDKPKILKWRNTKDVSKFMYSEHKITKSEHDIWFSNAIKNKNGYHWIVEFNGDSIGLASITDIDEKNSRCSTGFYLIDFEPRRGIGTFVKYSLIDWSFNELNINKVCSEHLAFNEAIITLNRKIGLSQEGYFRQHISKNGILQDVVYMSILREEWDENKRDIEAFLKDKNLL